MKVDGEGTWARKPRGKPQDPQSFNDICRDHTNEGVTKHRGDVEPGLSHGCLNEGGEVGKGEVKEEVDLFQRVMWEEDMAIKDANVDGVGLYVVGG